MVYQLITAPHAIDPTPSRRGYKDEQIAELIRVSGLKYD